LGGPRGSASGLSAAAILSDFRLTRRSNVHQTNSPLMSYH
jgi:hypothetical protein